MKVITFNDLFLRTLDEVLTDVFGKKSVDYIFSTMESVYQVQKEDIPDNTHLLSKTLEKTIGTGHLIIEDLLVENLYVKNGLDYENKKGYGFQDYIEDLKNRAI